MIPCKGRICFGPDLRDRKGIIGNVTLGGKILKNWKISGNYVHCTLYTVQDKGSVLFSFLSDVSEK